MTTLTATAPRADVSTIPFSRLVRVELRKAYDTRAGFWLLVAIGALVLVAEVIGAVARGVHDRSASFPVDYMAWENFASIAGVVTGLLLPVLGILLVTSEWSQRTGMVTFTLEPRRSSVIYAKIVVGVIFTVGTIIFALVMGLPFNALYGAISGHTDWSFPLKGVIGFFVTQNLAMLTGFALAALCLNTPAAIVVYVAFKFVVTGLLNVGENLMTWFSHVGPWLDFQSAQQPFFDWSFTGKEWGELIVSGCIWFVAPLVFGLTRILRAEVK